MFLVLDEGSDVRVEMMAARAEMINLPRAFDFDDNMVGYDFEPGEYDGDAQALQNLLIIMTTIMEGLIIDRYNF